MSLVDAIPASIKDIGLIRASAAGAGKRALGQSIAELGQMPLQAVALQNEQRETQRRERLTQIEEQQAQMQAQEHQQRSQLTDLQIAAAKKQAAIADIQGQATQAALQPDGKWDLEKGRQVLAQSPEAAGSIPAWMESMAKMNDAIDGMKKGAIDTATAEADHMGALAHGAKAMTDPDERAKRLVEGITGGLKSGLIAPEHANAAIASLVKDDGTLDSAAADALIAKMEAESMAQRKQNVSETEATALNAEREAQASARKAAESKLQLQNLGAQLSSAKNAQQYAQIYAGIPKELRDNFDPPEAFDPKTSLKKAAYAGMTPSERSNAEDKLNDNAMKEREYQLKVREQNYRETHPPNSWAEPGGIYAADTKRGYDAFVRSFEQKNVPDKNDRAGAPDTPTLEEWYVMTPSERQDVVTHPNARLTPTEMEQRRTGAPPQPARMASPAGADRSAPSAPYSFTYGGKVYTLKNKADYDKARAAVGLK